MHLLWMCHELFKSLGPAVAWISSTFLERLLIVHRVTNYFAAASLSGAEGVDSEGVVVAFFEGLQVWARGLDLPP